MSTDHGRATALGFGLGYLMAGVALLLQELGRLDLSWAYVVPLILICVGLAVLLSGVFGTRANSGITAPYPPTAQQAVEPSAAAEPQT